MEIPKSLQPVWAQVSKDGVISRDDYNQLLKAASPTGKKEELDGEKVNFLKYLKSQFESESGKSGGIPVAKIIDFSSAEPVKATIKDISEVPDKLKESWGRMISDGKITRDEYKELVEIASPNHLDEDLSPKEVAFLQNLRSLILDSKDKVLTLPEKKVQETTPQVEEAKTEKTPVKTNKEDKKVITTENKEAVNTPTVTEQKQDKTPIQKPVKKDDVNSNIPDIKGDTDENLDQLGKVKNILDAIGDDPDFANLKGIVDKRLSNSEKLQNYSKNVKSIFSAAKDAGDVKSLQEAKSMFQAEYDKLGDLKQNASAKALNQDMMSFVDSEISKIQNPAKTSSADKTQKQHKGNNSGKVKKPATNLSFVDNNDASAQKKAVGSNINVPDSLKDDWKKVSADNVITMDELNGLISKASPNDKPEELGAEEKDFLTKLYSKFLKEDGSEKASITTADLKDMEVPQANNETDIPDQSPQVKSTVGEVPESLKEAWSPIEEKGKITKSDYNGLIKSMKDIVASRPDKQLQPEEKSFLEDLGKKIQANNGELALTETVPASDNEQLKVPQQKSGPMLLNWPGYNKETKDALRNAFGNQTIDSKGMPLLPTAQGKKIANAFGCSGIIEMQKMVGAKPDGQFGPETFFKAKIYVANLINKGDTDQNKINTILNALGKNDKEVASMKANLGKVDSQTAQDDGVPASLKQAWSDITAKGSITKDDFETLLNAAAPNHKDSEFDDQEKAFLGQVRKALDENNGVINLKTPDNKAQNTAPSNAISIPQESVPDTLKGAWQQIASKGKVTTNDFESLLKVASPNKLDSEFDPKEKAFLLDLHKKLDSNNGEITLQASKVTSSQKSNQGVAVPEGKITSDGIPVDLKKTWDKLVAKGKITQDDFEQLLVDAAPNKRDGEFDKAELEFLGSIQKALKENNGVLQLKKK